MNEDQKKKIKEFPIKDIALNKEKLGSLTFDEAYKYFEDVQKLFIELIDLDYENKLTDEEKADIDNQAANFINSYLSVLESYDISQDNAKVRHDQITNNIKNFYNSFTKLYRPVLVFLRQEAGLEDKNAQDLEKSQKDVLAARKEYEKLNQELKEKIEELKNREAEVESGHGKVAATVLAKHFEEQSLEHGKNAKDWLDKRNKFFWAIIVIIIFNFVLYTWIFITHNILGVHLEIKDVFTVEYGIMKLALLSILSYGLAFCSKNYKIESNLRSVNIHRKNVAQTLDDFLAANPDVDTKSQMIKQGTEAMFKHLPIGYISNEEIGDYGPVNEIIYKVAESTKR